MGEHKERGSICAFYIKCLSVFSFFNLDSCLKKSRKKHSKKKELRANIFKVFQSNTAYEHKICHVLPSLLRQSWFHRYSYKGWERKAVWVQKKGASFWDRTLVDESSVRLLKPLDGVPPGNLVSQLPFS